MTRKRPPENGAKPRPQLRRITGRIRPSLPPRKARTIGNRPKRMILMVILLLIASLLMKRAGAPMRSPQRIPLSAGMGG
jgi:hypothetical protein